MPLDLQAICIKPCSLWDVTLWIWVHLGLQRNLCSVHLKTSTKLPVIFLIPDEKHWTTSGQTGIFEYLIFSLGLAWSLVRKYTPYPSLALPNICRTVNVPWNRCVCCFVCVFQKKKMPCYTISFTIKNHYYIDENRDDYSLTTSVV